MKTAGIIGGLAPQSTELFYRELIKLCQKRDKVEYPNILINSLETFKFVNLLNDKEKCIDYVKDGVVKIQDYVDFIASPCNTIHFMITELREFSKVPILAIHEEVCKKVKESNGKKVGILGTETTVYGNFYHDELNKLGVSYEVLDKKEEDILNKLIFEKMLYGKNYDEMRDLLLRQIGLFEKKGCDGVILACSELPLFISQEGVNLKLFPSTNILAESVYKKIFE